MTRFSRSGGGRQRAMAALRSSCFQVAEVLEPRVLLSTYTVINTNDSGPGSLRQAILNGNNQPPTIETPVVIAFSIPGTGVQTIAPTSPLPVISHTMTIDGTTQPGYSAAAGAPVIEIDGANTGGGANGLVVGSATAGAGVASGSVVKGLIINRFGGDGIVLQGSSDQVKGCYIGLNALGDAAASNGGNGLTIVGTQAVVGGSTTADRNVISGNRLAGIDDQGGGATITGNYLGTNAIGSAAAGNGREGLHVLNGATIGGAGLLRNVISGNGYSGIYVGGTVPVTITGNYIGTDATGVAAVGNGTAVAAPYGDGITIAGPAVQVGLPPVGTAAALGNVISANKGSGIAVANLTDTRVQVFGNLIGTNAAGNAALGNGGDGILTATALNIGPAQIFAATAGSVITSGGNVISGNGGDGILVQGGGGAIQDNYIGTNLAGTAAIPNASNGIELQGSGTFVGQDLGAGNVISGNGGNGIEIDSGNRLTGAGQNRIVNNLIGTDASGTVAVGNAGNGILVLGSNNNTIAGIAQRRQVISGNGQAGISLRATFGQGGGEGSIGGNYIGTNIAGTAPLANAGNGIEDFAGRNNITQNLISGNGGSGIYLGEPSTVASQSTGDQVGGNLIGTDKSGQLAAGLGNAGDGVTIFRSGNNAIGGTGSAANTIAGNGGNGVTVDSGGIAGPGDQPVDAAHNLITRNSIFSNGRLGIDLGNDGVTPNHPTSPTPGPNLFENFPVILSAISYPTYTLVWFAQTAPVSTTMLEFFTNDAADPSGHGEGQRFVGAYQAVGQVLKGATRLPVLPVGTILTATATDSGNDTSEFSLDVTTIAPPPIVTASSFNPQNNTIAITFNKDVSASLSPSAVRVHNQTTGQDAAVTSVSYDASTNTATFQLPGNLPAGTYQVTLLARAVHDASGTQLDGNNNGLPGTDYTFQFTYAAGDVNLDGAVSFADLLILADNFGQTATFAQGDLNHDGRVDFADLLILAQNYGRNAGSPAVSGLRLR